MRLRLLFSFLTISIPAIIYGQEITPYLNTLTNITNGQIELGPNISDGDFSFRAFIRLPLTDKENNILQLDRHTTGWTGVMGIDNITYFGGVEDDDGNMKGMGSTAYSIQLEYGSTEFTYYPTGKKAEGITSYRPNFAAEVKYNRYYTPGGTHKPQVSGIARLRYSQDWTHGDEVGVMSGSNANGVNYTTNMILDEPSRMSTLSVAGGLQYYSGNNRSISFTTAGYYDFRGKSGNTNPFSSSHRLRIEIWTFYYPLIKSDKPQSNMKIGIAPFISIRTKGTDAMNPVEYGALISIKFGKSFKQFF